MPAACDRKRLEGSADSRTGRITVNEMTDRICDGESNGRFVGFTYLGTQHARRPNRGMNCADNAQGTGSVTSVKPEIISSLLSAAVATITFERATVESPLH